ncbi:MAG: hypothetical protein AAFY48_00500 [Bacteroidota bacterium]
MSLNRECNELTPRAIASSTVSEANFTHERSEFNPRVITSFLRERSEHNREPQANYLREQREP